MFNDKSILITGGTGSFGKKFIKTILKNYSPRRIIIFSQDELKQFEMQQDFDDKSLRFFIGGSTRTPLVQNSLGVDLLVTTTSPNPIIFS